MNQLEENYEKIKELLKSADELIKDPTNLAMGAGVITAGGLLGPGLIGSFFIHWGIKKICDKIQLDNREKQEKEMMINKIVEKQQAIIYKLKEQNNLKSKEIENLKAMLTLLQEAQVDVTNDFAA